MPVTVTAVPLFSGPAPSRDDPVNFSARGDTLMTELVPFVPALNTTVGQINTVAGEINTLASTATTGANTATLKAAEALASANTAVNAPGTSGTSTTPVAIPSTVPTSLSFTTQTGKSWAVGQTVKITATSYLNNWVLGDITSYNSGTGAISVTVNYVQGSGTYVNWSIGLSAPVMSTSNNAMVTINANTTFYATDKGTFVDTTSSWTASLDTANKLGNGWYLYIRNSGPSTTSVTIDPYGSEPIEGVTTATVIGGETVLVMCDGSAFKLNRTVPGTGLTLLATVTPTVNSTFVDLLNVFNTSYDNYVVIGSGLAKNGTSTSLMMRVAVAGAADSGSSYISTSSTAGNATSGGLTTSFTLFSATSQAGFWANLFDVNSTTAQKMVSLDGSGYIDSAPTLGVGSYRGAYLGLSAVTGIRLFWADGNTFRALGKVRVYGLKNS